MVTYYHTKSYIYAVANGYCSKVLSADGRVDEHAPLETCPLVAGVRGMPGVEVPVSEIAEGMSLRFQIKGSFVTTQPVEKIELSVPSLSIPPVPMSGRSVSIIPPDPQSGRITIPDK